MLLSHSDQQGNHPIANFRVLYIPEEGGTRSSRMTVEAMNYIQPSKAVLSPLAYTEDRVKRDEVYDERPQLQRFKVGNRSPTSHGRLRQDENAWLPVHEENSVVEGSGGR